MPVPAAPVPIDSDAEVEGEVEPAAEPDEHARLQAALAQLPWQQVARKHPGWLWSDVLRCLAGHEARFHGVQRVKSYQYGLFKVGSKHCGTCEWRPQCTRSTDPGYSPVITVPLADALPMGTRLRSHQPQPKPVAPPRWRAPPPSRPGPQRARTAVLLPAELRKRWVGFADQCSAVVRLPPPVDRPMRRDWMAASPAARQHRRLTWEQHLARYALHGAAALSLEVPDIRHAELTQRVLQMLAA